MRLGGHPGAIFLAALRVLGRAEPLRAEVLEELEDNALMARFQQGDAAAFDVLMRRHERGVLHFILRSVRDHDRAQDLTQDVFLRVVRTADRWQPSARFSTWVYTIARNLCIDESRRRRFRPIATLDAPVGDEGGLTHLDRVADPAARSGAVEGARQQFRATLDRALDALPDEQREVIVLRVIEGMRFVEIAQMHGISENTVKSRMRYAVAALRTAVAEWDDFSFDEEDDGDVGGNP